MFESVTFITDAGQKLVCGKNNTGHNDYDYGYGNDYGYGSGQYGHGSYGGGGNYGGDYQRGDYPTAPYSKGPASTTRTLKQVSSASALPTKPLPDTRINTSVRGAQGQPRRPSAVTAKPTDDKSDNSKDNSYEDGETRSEKRVYQHKPYAKQYGPYTHKASKHAARDARRRAREGSYEDGADDRSHYGHKGLLLDSEDGQEGALSSTDGRRQYKNYNPRDQSERRYYGQPRCVSMAAAACLRPVRCMTHVELQHMCTQASTCVQRRQSHPGIDLLHSNAAHCVEPLGMHQCSAIQY